VPTIVRFRALAAAEITDYVHREQPLDCAGAFKSEGLGIALFDGIDSEDPTALVGLPLIALCRMLASAGWPVLGASGRA
jgi:septum formation protein